MGEAKAKTNQKDKLMTKTMIKTKSDRITTLGQAIAAAQERYRNQRQTMPGKVEPEAVGAGTATLDGALFIVLTDADGVMLAAFRWEHGWLMTATLDEIVALGRVTGRIDASTGRLTGIDASTPSPAQEST